MHSLQMKKFYVVKKRSLSFEKSVLTQNKCSKSIY